MNNIKIKRYAVDEKIVDRIRYFEHIGAHITTRIPAADLAILEHLGLFEVIYEDKEKK